MQNWKQFFVQYSDTISRLSNTKKVVKDKVSLSELDIWYHKDLVDSIKEKKYVTREQLVQIAEWKMTRGIWRPRNKSLIEKNSDAEIKKISKESFNLIPLESAIDSSSLKKAISHLSQLQGIGPATSSAVLSAYRKDIPFMSDEGLIYFSIPLKYSLTDYMSYYEKIHSLAIEEGTNEKEMEESIFVYSILDKLTTLEINNKEKSKNEDNKKNNKKNNNETKKNKKDNVDDDSEKKRKLDNPEEIVTLKKTKLTKK